MALRASAVVFPGLFFGSFVGLVWGCATPSGVTRMDIQELHAQLRVERQHSADLEARLTRLEDQRLVRKMTADGASAARAAEEDATMPSLSVVKLKPKREPAPPLDTHKTVSEPAPERLDDLASSSAPGGALDVTALGDAPQEDPAVLDANYEASVAALRTGNVDGSVASLEGFAQSHPKHPKADNALYYAAVGRMGLEDYAGAARTLQNLIAHYPAGDALQGALLKLAECRVRQRNPSEARTLYARILSSYPGTDAATQAQQQLSALSR